ncbi:MAG: glutaminyl-peptide cyclotransferase, partial [Ginsengibacter sp.]
MKYFLSAIILMAIISCNNDSTPSYDASLPQSPFANIPPPAPITFTIDSVYDHDPTAFTQGLEFYNGKLYEGTGEPKQSRLRIVNITTGKAEKEMLIKDPEIFGEGITIFKNKIYQLTWQNNKIFEYNLNDFSKPLVTYNWSREGWGATNDGKRIIISDGTSHLYFVQPDEQRKEMKIEKILTVMSNKGEVDSLN